MKKMLSVLIGLGLLVATASTGFAIPLIWDVSAAGAPAHGDADTLTGVFNQMGFDSQTSTIQYDTDGSSDVSVGDKFDDAGDLRVNGLIAPGIIDTEGLNQAGGYEVTAKWTNVKGFVNAVDVLSPTNTRLGLTYTSGTIDFYLDNALDSSFANPGGSAPPSGAGGTGFDGGTSVKIAELTLLTGIGNTFIDFTGNDLANQGSVELSLQFTFLRDDFWRNAAGVDLLDLAPVNWHFLTTDMNIDTPTQLPSPGASYVAHSNQNGSAELTVVPEPSTVILLGSGLLGLAFLGRRKARKS